MASSAARYESAIKDGNWLEPSALYHHLGQEIPETRPIFQGDVFTNVPLPVLPANPMSEELANFEMKTQTAMVIPHPCQCYHGDRLREFLTVAPVSLAESYGDFGPDMSGGKDKFPLPDLMLHKNNGTSRVKPAQSYVAAFGRMVSVPSTYLNVGNRIACLSHKGLGFLAKRVLSFQIRSDIAITAAMSFTAEQWAEADLMQSWVSTRGRLDGYTTWLKGEEITHPLDSSRRIRRDALLSSRPDLLMGMLTGQTVEEPDD